MSAGVCPSVEKKEPNTFCMSSTRFWTAIIKWKIPYTFGVVYGIVWGNQAR